MATITNAPKRQPNTLWRGASSFVMGVTGSLTKGFLFGLNSVEVIGMERFLDLLETRKDPWKRERGLITVSNHISILDDPLMWGVLPLKYAFEPSSLRWSLGAHDICFANKILSTFFSVGQVLPTHRNFHSPLGGIFQPTMTQAIRLLSSAPYTPKTPGETPEAPSLANVRFDVPDPFSTGSLTYSTTGRDLFVAPSAYWLNRHSWVHIFPEGGVHQHATRSMRYFKWGIARLILEAEPVPNVVPMFIDGTCDMYPEDRSWPRFVPRAGKHVRVAFGEAVDTEKVFGDLRKKWQSLVEKSKKASATKLEKEDGSGRGNEVMLIGDLPDDLKYSKEAEAIRIEVAHRVRNEVLKVRRSLGYPEEDPKNGLAETWAKDPKHKPHRSPVDGSLENPV